MIQSESIADLAAALVAAQAEMTNAPKETKGQVGNQVRYYTDLPTLTDLVRPILAKHGLAYVQLPSGGNGSTVSLATRLVHRSGEWLEDEYSMPAGQGAQGVGSALTYARRYALMALLGIAADDDDGAAATAPPKRAGTTRGASTAARAAEAPDSPGALAYARLKEPMSQASKDQLKELALFHERTLTVPDLDADPDWLKAVLAVLDGAPRT